MSSFLARGRDEVVVERDDVLVPELIKDSSCEVKARVFEEFADVFLYDILD